MRKRIFAAILCFCVLLAPFFAETANVCRAYDAVLGIESYMKWLRLFDGEEYEDKIAAADYALIGKKEAFDAYKALAERGNVQAMCAVAECYDYGVIDNANLEKAYEWWARAAEKNYAPALNALGTFYSPSSYHARLFGENEDMARSFFEKAAAAGYGKAFANLNRFDEAIRAGYTDAYVYYAAYLIEMGDAEAVEKGISLYMVAANENASSYAMYALMKLYSDGEYCDLERAKYWARRYSALHYAEVKEERERNAVLLPYIKKRADVGDVNSMFELSQLYGSNYLDAVNPSYRALHIYYLKKASEGGSKKAMKALAHAYEMGDGVPCDKKLAADLYEQSIGEDDILSEMSLRTIYIESLPAEVRHYVNDRVAEKEKWRQAAYAPSYADSYEGITRERAFDYVFAHAGENDDCRAAAAYCLFFGIGCDSDEEKARELGFESTSQEGVQSEVEYQAEREEYLRLRDEEEERLVAKAEKEKTGEAYFALYDFYDGFYNTLEMEAKCFELLKKAARQNNPKALRELARYYQDGKSCVADPRTAAQLLQLAAGLGDYLAQEELAECYLQGFGVEYDFDEAVAWLLLSARNGNASAQSMLRHFGYSDIIEENLAGAETEIASEGGESADFEYDEGLDEDYSESDFGEVWGNAESGDENAMSEQDLALLGEPTIISLKNHAGYAVGAHSTLEECAITFWASLLSGSSAAWKECIAYEGEEYDERVRTLEAVFPLARALGALDELEIRFFFKAAEGADGVAARVPTALYEAGEFQSSSLVEFVRGDDGLWYMTW